MTSPVILAECDNHSQLLKHLLKDVTHQMTIWRLHGDHSAVRTMQRYMDQVILPGTTVMLEEVNAAMRFLRGVRGKGFTCFEYYEVSVPPKALSPGPYKYRLARRSYENPRGYLRQP